MCLYIHACVATGVGSGMHFDREPGRSHAVRTGTSCRLISTGLCALTFLTGDPIVPVALLKQATNFGDLADIDRSPPVETWLMTQQPVVCSPYSVHRTASLQVPDCAQVTSSLDVDPLKLMDLLPVSSMAECNNCTNLTKRWTQPIQKKLHTLVTGVSTKAASKAAPAW